MAILQGLVPDADRTSDGNGWINLSVHPDTLPDPETGEMARLSPRYTTMTLRRNVIFTLVLAIMSLVAIGIIWVWWTGFFLLLPLANHFLIRAYLIRLLESRSYTLRQRDITYRSGWIWRQVTSIPFHRIQHCEVKQGPFEKWYGLSRLEVYTAGKSDSDMRIPGLESDLAERLKDYILHQVATREEEE